MMLNVHRNRKAYYGREDGGNGVWRWGEREITYLSLHCHHQNYSCIQMGSDESHFNVCSFPLPRVDPLNDTRAHAPACQQTQGALRLCHGRFYCQRTSEGQSHVAISAKTQTAKELKMSWIRMLLLNYMDQF